MTNEEAIAFLEQYINSEVYTEKCISAHEMAITALRSAHAGDSIGYHFPDTTKMVPLTLEQLREMDGRPVRMEDLTGGTLWNQWIIFERHTDDGFIPRGGGYFGCDSYGVKWLAYAYPPAHIDREAWTAEWIKYDGYTECSKCKHWYDSPESEDDGDRPAFCPSCGRAMTPEAWAELEKRMGVVR